MAEQIRFEGVTVAIRSTWRIWLLSVVTFGIFGVIWWFWLNRELRDYSAAVGRPLGNNPALAAACAACAYVGLLQQLVLNELASGQAVDPVLGAAAAAAALLWIPAVLTYVHTTRRVRAIQRLVSAQPLDPPQTALAALLGVAGNLLWPGAGLHLPYLQGALNANWRRARDLAAEQSGALATR